MSFDPFNQQQPPRDPVPPPDSFSAQPSGQDVPSPQGSTIQPSPGDPVLLQARARERVLFPAVLLIVAGILNFIFGGLVALRTLTIYMVSDEDFTAELKKEMMKQNPANLAELERRGFSIEKFKSYFEYTGLGLTGSNVLIALLSIFSGIRLLQFRNYGLILFSSLLILIPCVSGSGCCCIGQIAGLWTIFLLLQHDVYDAFR